LPELRPAADVAWAVEDDCITLWRRGAAPVSLRYPEAAAWDLVARGASNARMVRLLAAIWAIGEKGAAEQLEALLMQWRHRGWLEESGPAGG
jgi:hypothetical protein